MSDPERSQSTLNLDMNHLLYTRMVDLKTGGSLASLLVCCCSGVVTPLLLICVLIDGFSHHLASLRLHHHLHERQTEGVKRGEWYQINECQCCGQWRLNYQCMWIKRAVKQLCAPIPLMGISAANINLSICLLYICHSFIVLHFKMYQLQNQHV